MGMLPSSSASAGAVSFAAASAAASKDSCSAASVDPTRRAGARRADLGAIGDDRSAIGCAGQGRTRRAEPLRPSDRIAKLLLQGGVACFVSVFLCLAGVKMSLTAFRFSLAGVVLVHGPFRTGWPAPSRKHGVC